MSRVLQALESSEQQHSRTSFVSRTPLAQSETAATKTSPVIYLACLLVPVAIATGVSVYQIYQSKLAQWQEHSQPKPVTVEVEASYSVQDYPEFGRLALNHYQPMPRVELSPQRAEEVLTQVTPAHVEEAAAPIEVKGDNALAGLDLSALPPELALRVENALGDTNTSRSSSATRRQDSIIELAQQADKWHGKLPALNFQTHVYSSNEKKRWVKINGTEYSQGDWIGDIQLVAIEQQSCVIQLGEQRLRVPALYDWKG
ncbi:general secretion pathway protein GspB [Vibrio sp. TRT 21S02]|uniref:general secretion pathway protein GspB n=1 Tax=Vibrio sp. TRT 21S02 TaxID=3418507 RepID=UPI003CF6E307